MCSQICYDQDGKGIYDLWAATLKRHITHCTLMRVMTSRQSVTWKLGGGGGEGGGGGGGGARGRERLLLSGVQGWPQVSKHDQELAQWHTVFLFTESGEIIAWRAYNVGPGKAFSVASVTRLGAPDGFTNLQARQVFSSPGILTGLPFLFQHAGITACSTFSGAYSLRGASAWRRRE